MAEAVGRGPGRGGAAGTRRGGRSAPAIEMPTTAGWRMPTRPRRSVPAAERAVDRAPTASTPAAEHRRRRPRPAPADAPTDARRCRRRRRAVARAADAASRRPRRLSCPGARPSPASRPVVPARARGPHRRSDAPRRDVAAVRWARWLVDDRHVGRRRRGRGQLPRRRAHAPARRPIRRSPGSGRRSPARCRA